MCRYIYIYIVRRVYTGVSLISHSARARWRATMPRYARPEWRPGMV